jgi:hypothetical protein
MMGIEEAVENVVGHGHEESVESPQAPRSGDHAEALRRQEGVVAPLLLVVDGTDFGQVLLAAVLLLAGVQLLEGTVQQGTLELALDRKGD